MPIRADRIEADIRAIAACTHTPGNGATRPTFSAEWARARDYVIHEATRLGCRVRIDAAGNVFARPIALDASTRTWLCGSHIDTVPHGGDYDGVAGIVTALELLRSASDDGIVVPLELVIFAEEEGPTFGLGMLGSRALVGELTAEQLGKLKNSEGQTYLEAGAPHGVRPEAIAAARLRPDSHLGFIELHIEQGPGLWRRDQRLAIVTAIAGRRQYRVTVSGEANHAGATSMADRRDALAAAAEIIVDLETLAPILSREAVLTVGRMTVAPNAINVIADRVEFTIDFRAPGDDLLEEGEAQIRRRISSIVDRRKLTAELKQTEIIAARPMSPALVHGLTRSAAALGRPEVPLTVSGALHDSAVLAPRLPTVMVFVPSRDGISHNPAEFSRVEDVAEAARVIEHLVRRPTVAQLDAMPQDAFVALLGGIYEHSPWIAERASDRRPAGSLAALLQTFARVVVDAADDERLSLIRAHPDLVGRLARENALTRDSSREQSAAGLTTLTPDEVATFERYNAAYRERFGFPFVICARLNRKEAILNAFPIRLENTREAEMAAAIAEIHKIAELRLRDLVWEEVSHR